MEGFAKGYNSFSGVDIKGVFGNKVVAELQAISWSITREKAPIYTMGSADPRSFSRGKRGIAGTLIFIVFDRHVLLGQLGMFAEDSVQSFLSDKDDMRPNMIDIGTVVPEEGATTGPRVSDGNTPANEPGANIMGQESALTSVGSDQEAALAWYSDQIPPFDITLAAANEYGALAVMRIFGVEVMNEGCGVSIDDIVTEQQHTYVARTLIGWRPVASVSPGLMKAKKE